MAGCCAIAIGIAKTRLRVCSKAIVRMPFAALPVAAAVITCVAVTAIGLTSSVLLGWLISPFLRIVIRLYDWTISFKEEVLLLLVRDYGFPENAKELVALFAKKRLQGLYAKMREFAAPYIDAGKKLYKKFRISFTILVGSVEQKIRETWKMVA